MIDKASEFGLAFNFVAAYTIRSWVLAKLDTL